MASTSNDTRPKVDGTTVSPYSLTQQDLKQPGLSFHDLLAHAGHDLTVKTYRAGALTFEATLVCKTCGRQLRSASNPTIKGNVQFRIIVIYANEAGESKAKAFIVKAETWTGRRAAIEDTVYPAIPKERVQSIMVDDSTNNALFESFWAQLPPPDDQLSH